ncbi:MAG: RloB domain-containing protein [Methanomassiliicoccus sp.]|nr:RloB domain-containing protein [Methanomassiliicoccus sp.]
MNGYRRRKEQGRARKKLLYIVCEGKKTEPIYFNNFRTPECDFNIVITTDGKKNATGLVSKAVEIIDCGPYDADYGDKIWCVFDVDQNSDEELDKASKIALDKGIFIALSNPCFEIWYLVHFIHCSSRISSYDLLIKLDTHIKGYHKTMDVFEQVEPKTPTAVKNAKILNKMHEKASVKLYGTDSNPSSQVFKVIETIYQIEKYNTK